MGRQNGHGNGKESRKKRTGTPPGESPENARSHHDQCNENHCHRCHCCPCQSHAHTLHFTEDLLPCIPLHVYSASEQSHPQRNSPCRPTMMPPQIPATLLGQSLWNPSQVHRRNQTPMPLPQMDTQCQLLHHRQQRRRNMRCGEHHRRHSNFH